MGRFYSISLRYFLSTWVLLIISCIANAQKLSEVVIKTNAHNALINDIALVPNSNLVLTCSFDKTIKIWNTNTMAYEDELLGEIGGEGLGTYNKIRVSPDGKKVAATCIAFATNSTNTGNHMGVRVFDIASRKLEKLIPEKFSDICGIEYIHEGKTLLIASALQMYFIDCATWKITDTAIAPYDEDITKVFYYKKQIHFLSKQGKLYRYDEKERDNKLITDFGEEVWTITAHESSSQAAIVTATGDVKLLDGNFQSTSSMHSDDFPISLCFSPDGKGLLVGYYYTIDGCNYYATANQKLQPISALKDQYGLVGTSIFYAPNKAITAGGDHNSVDFWKLSLVDTAQLLHTCESASMPIMAACMYGGSIGFSTELNFSQNSFPYRWMFNTSTHQSMSIIPMGTIVQMLPKPVMKQINLEIEIVGNSKTGMYEVKIINNGSDFNTLTAIDASTATILPNNTIAIGGRKGQLRVYDIYGQEVADLVGNNDMITGLTIDAMDQYLIVSSKDGTIKFWDLRKIDYHDNFNSTPADEIEDPDFMKKANEWGLWAEVKDKSTLGWYAVIRACFKDGKNEWGNTLYQKLAFLKKFFLNHVKAEMNLFISSNNEWVLWDKNNYYTGSKEGCKMIGFHVNGGIEHEAKFYPFEQFDLTNNRPDLIYQFFEPYDTATIKAYHNAYLKRLKNLNINPDKLLMDGKIPQLKLLNVSGNSVNPSLNLNFQAIDSFSNLDKIIVTVNDVPVFGSGGKSITTLNTKEFNTQKQLGILPPIILSTGANKIQVSVINQHGAESFRETFNIQYAPPTVVKPKLYVVSIGVSKYKNAQYNLTYAAKDANDIATNFSSQKGRFDSIITITLLDEQVTRANILKVKQTLQRSKVDDQVVIFLAGHGLLDKNFNFYYATHDMDFTKPALMGVSFTEIENLLDGIASRNKLLMVDACHSGEVDASGDIDIGALQAPAYSELPEGMKVTTYLKRGSELLEPETKNKDQMGFKNSVSLMSEMFYDLRRSSGAIVISAASAEGFALESPTWHNGVFTYSVISGLQNNTADANADKEIAVSELKDYIIKQVGALTQGKQQPTMRRENPSNNFRVW